jgi:hypothetical protein
MYISLEVKKSVLATPLHILYLRDVWIQTHRAAVASRLATNQNHLSPLYLATHLPPLTTHHPPLATHLPH